MNKLSRTIIVATAALATVVTSTQFASARDRYGYWRHHGHFNNRVAAAGVLGLTAGVLVGAALSQPRVVYRERPVVVEDEAPVYADPDVVYADPEAEYLGPVDEYRHDDAYVAPRHQRPAYDNMDDQAQDDGYFPDRPQKKSRDTVVAQGKLEPWTAKWRSYCKQRYQSFNSTTGTYAGYDGKQHFCTAG